MVVLVGAKTKCRKHVDWEISGALNLKVGESYAGLFGILLPTHPYFNEPAFFHDDVPKRLVKNIESGYAEMIKWSLDKEFLQSAIERAYDRRKDESDKRVNSVIPQMKKNTCE